MDESSESLGCAAGGLPTGKVGMGRRDGELNRITKRTRVRQLAEQTLNR